jgi:outer membrane lipoprotein-sorting protein
MKSKIVIFVAGAVIVVACVFGLALWRTTGSGIALADVLSQVQQIPAYMYQMTMTISGKGPMGQDINENMEGTILLSQDDGMKMVTNSVGPDSGKTSRLEMYILPEEKTAITLMPDIRQYMRMEFDDTFIEKTRRENYDPASMLKQILDGNYESIGRSTIEGLEVEGYQTTDPKGLDAMSGQGDMKIWVDVKTQLPVRLEMDGEVGDMRIHAVIHNFQWDYPVDADTFKLVIPTDYTSLSDDPIKMPTLDEEGAIEGLKRCADLTGRYPEKLDFMTVASLIGKSEDKYALAPDPPELPVEEDTNLFKEESLKQIMELPREERPKKMQEHLKKMKEHIKRSEQRSREWEEQFKKWQEQIEMRDEQLKKRQGQFDQTMNKFMPIQGAVMFYMMLVQEKKEPAYYGKTVTSKDVDEVLLRWKVSDNKYRVIYGDLHAETVTPEKLAELENAFQQ